ncbi:MAG: phosphohydrolase, partial [Treponema sp.]|nr:phosphohydrolase [Treponema sp.]
MMKKIPNPYAFAGITPGFLLNKLKQINLPHLGLVPGIVCLCSFLAAALVIVTNIDLSVEGLGDIRDFEVGRVADRDIVAEYPLSYIDREATRLRMEAQEMLIPAVFRYSADVNIEVFKLWNNFCDLSDSLTKEELPLASARLAIMTEYPSYFSNDAINAWYASPRRAEFRDYGQGVLNAVLEKGVFALDAADMGKRNPDMVELLIFMGNRIERERVSITSIISMDNAGDAIAQAVENAEQGSEMPPSFKPLAPALLKPFIQENAFFSGEDTDLRVAEAMERVPAVINSIEKGKRVIRKGFVITAEEMLDLRALNEAIPQKDPRRAIGLIFLLALLYVLFILLQGKLVMKRKIPHSESCLLFVLVCLYLAGAGLARNLVPALSHFPVSLFFPTALMVMIPAVFMGP